MKILELFSGYGTATFALKALGIKYKVIGYSDIDKYANQCFQQNHISLETIEDRKEYFNNPKELGDVTKIDPYKLEDFDLLTGGFPCQAFSIAGKGLGELDTRGTLFNEIIRIAEVKKPTYMLLENVKGLMNKKHKPTFDKILSELQRIGYFVHHGILNTKDYGIPQNRERVFFICFRNHGEFFNFKYPKKEELNIFLKDILEDEVDEKYYLSDKVFNQLLINIREKGKWNTNPSGNGMNGNVNKKNISTTLSTNKGEGSKILIDMSKQVIGTCHPRNDLSFGARYRVYNPNKISPTLSATMYKQPPLFLAIKNEKNKIGFPKIIQVGLINQTCKKRTHDTPKEINLYLRDNKEGYSIKVIANYLNLPKTQVEHYFRTDSSRAIPSPDIWLKLKELLNFDKTYDKQVTDIYEKEITFESSRRVYHENGISPTIAAANADKIIAREYVIRKLTPKECFRLQGFLNDEVNLEGLSNTQQYKLAGNGQSINVVKKIFKNMFANVPCTNEDIENDRVEECVKLGESAQ